MEEKAMITVTLTRDEIQERASALAQYANKLIELEEEEEDVKAGHKSRMARLKERRLEIGGEIRRLSRAVRLGVEERSEQRVLFDEERRMEEFRREREVVEKAEELIKQGEELIEQQQQAVAEQQANRRAVEEFFAESEERQSVLSLVFEDPIALEVIDGWTIEQKEQAMKWATAAHLQASDNDIDVPPVPEFLKTDQRSPEEERERLHKDAVARWRRERPATMEADKEEAEEATIEKALHRALHSVQGAAERWRPLQQIGAADAVLTKAIADEWGLVGGSTDHGGYEYKGGKSPQFTWFDDGPRYKAQKLTGKRLLAKVREVMGIGAPGQSNDPDADHSAAYPDDEIEAMQEEFNVCDECGVENGHEESCSRRATLETEDNFTAPRCDECKRTDGAHTKECSKNPDRLTPDDYLKYAQANYKTNHQSHARKMSVTGLMDNQIREWKQQQQTIRNDKCVCGHIRDWHDGQGGCCMGCKRGECDEFRWNPDAEQQAGNGAETEPAKESKKSAKLSPVEAAIDR